MRRAPQVAKHEAGWPVRARPGIAVCSELKKRNLPCNPEFF